jgi:hypothetical protein
MPRHLIESCANPGCRKSYHVERFSKAFASTLPPGQVQCPYCFAITQKNPSRAYRTFRLPFDDGKDWLIQSTTE